MYSTHEAELDVPGLPAAARHVHIVPELLSGTLLSMGQLCDAGCRIAFDSTDVTVFYDNKIVLTGKRTPLTRLWKIDLPVPPTAIVNHQAYHAVGSATPAQLVAFSHAALWSPALSTLDTALTKGFVSNFPGLSNTTLRKYPPASIPMHKGHMDQTRQNKHSTKPKKKSKKPTEVDTETFPESTPDGARTHCHYAATVPITGQVYTDQTGRFVVPSSNGNNYLIVLYDYDSNVIMAHAIPSRSAKDILAGYKILHARLCEAGLKPQLQRLDNECSTILKDFMDEKGIS
jgi:hypothetical protein